MSVGTEAGSGSTAATPRVTSCNTCAATLERDQRYCVACGSRNPAAPDAAASHLAAATRDSRLVASARSGGSARVSSPWTIPLLLAVPLALAVGLLIGQGSADDELLKALSDRPAPVVRVDGAGVAADSVGAAAAAGKAQRRVVRKVLANSAAGPLEDIVTYRPSKSKIASDIKAIKRCQSKKGTDYLSCQKDLPAIVGTGPAGGGGGDDGGPSGQGD